MLLLSGKVESDRFTSDGSHGCPRRWPGNRPTILKLDFSEFHDTMHPPFTRYCRGLYPGGWRAGVHHLKLAWEFHRRDQVFGPFHRFVLCKLGRHRVMVFYSNPDDGTVRVRPVCKFCPFERVPSEAEIDNVPPFFRPR